MSLSLLRLAYAPLFSLSLVACVAEDDGAGSAEPISSQESALTEQAVEGTVLAMAPITSGSPAVVAAAYQASFGTGGLSCATVASDDLTYVTVTFACTGALATTGSVHLQLVSPTKLEATADLTIGGVAIDGSLSVTVPIDPAAERTFEGEISIEGSRRSLTAEAMASWKATGDCVTYDASGSIAAEGPHGSAAGSFEISGKTVCRK